MDIHATPRHQIVNQFRERIALGKRTRLYKTDFESLIAKFIESLSQLERPEEIQKLCLDEIALLEEGYPQTTLASDYIPQYRKAISEAMANGELHPSQHRYLHHQRLTGLPQQRDEHWALTFFKYSRERYEQLDHRQAKVNRKRLLNLQKVNPWQYLELLNELLQASGKFAARHRTIAIVGLTGRRFGEVVALGSFSLTSHPYLLRFEGQQKSEREGYNIITLIPAETVLKHLEQLREMTEVRSLFSSDNAKHLKQAINKFDVQVNRECDKLLTRSKVVPPLQGKKHVTIHNLRSLWGAIATFLFCPPEHHEYAFLQHYLGHILESSATGHYFRYLLVDSNGELLQQKGIKLEDVPPLPLVETEEEHQTENEMTMDHGQSGPQTDRDQQQSESSLQGLQQPISEQGRKVKMKIEEIQKSLQKEWLEDIESAKTDLTLRMVTKAHSTRRRI